MAAAFLFVLFMFAIAVFAMLFAFRGLEGRWPRWLVREREEARTPQHALWSEMLAVIEADLLDNPDDWVSDGYHLTNSARGVRIWIANRDYGLGVSVVGREGSKELALSDRDKKGLWVAVEARLAASIVNRFRDAA